MAMSTVHLCNPRLRHRGHVHSRLGIRCAPELEIPWQHEHMVTTDLWRVHHVHRKDVLAFKRPGSSAGSSSHLHYLVLQLGVHDGMGAEAV